MFMVLLLSNILSTVKGLDNHLGKFSFLTLSARLVPQILDLNNHRRPCFVDSHFDGPKFANLPMVALDQTGFDDAINVGFALLDHVCPIPPPIVLDGKKVADFVLADNRPGPSIHGVKSDKPGGVPHCLDCARLSGPVAFIVAVDFIGVGKLDANY
jgi:hypothetical protein